MTDICEKTVRDRLLLLFPPRSNLVAFNMTALGPYDHEIDFLRVTPSGYVQEFEIKVTRTDIRAELSKAEKHRELLNGISGHYPDNKWADHLIDGSIVESHGYGCHSISARYKHPIKEFYVAIPKESDLLDYALTVLPEWVGVVELDRRPHLSFNGCCVNRVATKHKYCRKITDAERIQIYKSLTYRFWEFYHGRGGYGRGNDKHMADERLRVAGNGIL